MKKIMRLWHQLLLIVSMTILCIHSAQAQKWDYLTGKGYVICDAILKRLNSYQWTQEQTYDYVWSVVASYPGWKEPIWEELDPQEHKELIFELIKYQSLGADVYFGRKKQSVGFLTPSALQEKFRLTMESGVRLRVLRTHLINWLDEKPAPPGDQMIVQLRYKMKPQNVEKLRRIHPEKPIVEWDAGTFIVTDDLQGPDPRVRDWHASTMAASPVLLFGGNSYFINGSGLSFSIIRDFGSGPSSFCELQFDFKK